MSFPMKYVPKCPAYWSYLPNILSLYEEEDGGFIFLLDEDPAYISYILS